MIQFAKIIEVQDYQFLIRSCHHPALAMLPQLDEEEFDSLLTIDTEYPTAAKPQLMRMVVNCQRPEWQQRLFNMFAEAHCERVLEILHSERTGQLTHEGMIDATDKLQKMFVQEVRETCHD